MSQTRAGVREVSANRHIAIVARRRPGWSGRSTIGTSLSVRNEEGALARYARGCSSFSARSGDHDDRCRNLA
jgi:hypothetical protein